jgi:hypothetical protein
LVVFEFRLDSLKNFFHKIGIQWTRHITTNDFLSIPAVSFAQLQVASGGGGWINGNEYTYPDEDFCVFALWPHENGILPRLDSDNLVVCTSTMRWLMNFSSQAQLDNEFLLTKNGSIYSNYVMCVVNSTFWDKTLIEGSDVFSEKDQPVHCGAQLWPHS